MLSSSDHLTNKRDIEIFGCLIGPTGKPGEPGEPARAGGQCQRS